MSNSDTRNIYDLIRSAYAAKRNRNLQSVVLNFKVDIDRLRELEEREESDTYLNRHPVCVIYSSHICLLTGSEVADRTNDAFEWCEKMLQQEILQRPDVPVPQDSN